MNYFRLMQEGMGKFQGTPEEIRFTVATADLALQRGETDTALNILRTIGSEQPYFIQAKEKMAQIFLYHRKDKKMYAQCFRQIVETSPTPQSYILLGDAYMAIQVKIIYSEISQNFVTFSEYDIMNFNSFSLGTYNLYVIFINTKVDTTSDIIISLYGTPLSGKTQPRLLKRKSLKTTN